MELFLGVVQPYAEVQAAVTTLCSVRRVKKGKVTVFLDSNHAAKIVAAAERRERKRLEGIAEQQRKDAEKGVRFNTAMEETLAQNGEAIEAHLEMLGHAKGNFSNLLT
jgi:antitoxin (DNA-binding transcriptional repressor) of toxin-antitoxin stability system